MKRYRLSPLPPLQSRSILIIIMALPMPLCPRQYVTRSPNRNHISTSLNLHPRVDINLNQLFPVGLRVFQRLIIDVAISVIRFCRCFCAACNMDVDAGEDVVDDVDTDGDPEVMIIALLLPCMLIDASMLIVIGVGVVAQVSSSSVFVSISLSG